MQASHREADHARSPRSLPDGAGGRGSRAALLECTSLSLERPPVELAIVPKEDAPVLRNLFQLYAHDFSEQVHLEVGADGRFGVTTGLLTAPPSARAERSPLFAAG